MAGSADDGPPRRTQTPLVEQLREGGRRAQSGPLAAFKLARKDFLASKRVDMGAIAAKLDVDRTTLFRWVGNRDQLLCEVIWSTSAPTFEAAIAKARGHGAELVVDTFARYVRTIAGAPFFREYVVREGQRALRVLTTSATDLETRTVAVFETLIEREIDADQLPLPPRDMAFVILRIAQSFLYTDQLVGEAPSVEKAVTVVATIFGVPTPPRD